MYRAFLIIISFGINLALKAKKNYINIYNNKMKSIKRVLSSPRSHWVGNGFNVHPVFNDLAFTNEISPFLMFDYAAPKQFEPTNKRRGVGQHPHRGFETVTIACQGEVEHGDSKGHRGVIGPGDVQWMTAASGIVHEEFHSTQFSKEGGVFEMAQLWVNLPKKHKMAEPKYQPILNAEIPLVALPDDAGDVRVIAGEYSGIIGRAKTFTPINMWDVRLKAGKSAHLTLPSGHNTILFVRSGLIRVGEVGSGGDSKLGVAQAALLTMDGTSVHIGNIGDDEALLVVLGGEPLNESIAARGPFVMNTQEELYEAMEDYQEGRLGSHFNH